MTSGAWCQFWCQLVLPYGSLVCAALRRRELTETPWIRVFLSILPLAVPLCATVRNGFVGINSAVSYRLDHAPAAPLLYLSLRPCEVWTLRGCQLKN
jgi:hypothetical protein